MEEMYHGSMLELEYVDGEESVFEEEMDMDVDITSIINQNKHLETFLKIVDDTYSREKLSTNTRFITRLKKEFNTKLDGGYPSSQLLNNTMQTWKYDTNDGEINLDNMTSTNIVINTIFKNIEGYRSKTISDMKSDINYYGGRGIDYEYFLDDPFKWTYNKVEKIKVNNVSSEGIEKPTKVNEYEYKPRRFPTTINNEEIDDEGEFIMNSIDLLKKGKMNYIAFGYLQSISDGDKNDYDKFRKVYIKYINNSTMAKECKGISRNTVNKALLRLESLGLLSRDTFKDDNGEYKKLYNLDGNYEILDFGQKPIQKLVTCIKSEGLALFLIIRKYCRMYNNGKCTLTQEQLFEKLGYANNETSRKSMNLFLEVLEDIGCIRIERIRNEKNQNKNIYYSLV
ncbi:hypothetical protein [Romboutsia sp.]|uniref:hypothetical protein n=1 Tax=Romboutsia sp. TaxID=1965302 RepID=UPI003F2EBD38